VDEVVGRRNVCFMKLLRPRPVSTGDARNHATHIQQCGILEWKSRRYGL